MSGSVESSITNVGTGGGGGSGTVTSVGLADDASASSTIFNVAATPVTTTGTITLGLANQSANTVLAGPTTGAAATPGYRSLVAADVPNLAASKITSGTLAVAQGGTGLASGTSGGVLAYTASGTLASSGALTANAIVLGGGAGVAPTPMGSLGTTTTVLHGNAAGAPTFGAVSLTADVSGTLPLGNGGTGATTKAGAFDALSPMTTSGDVIYGGASGTGTRLAKGSDGQVLTLASGLPSWAAGLAVKAWAASYHWVNGYSGHGSTGTTTLRYTTVVGSAGSDITYASNPSNLGDTWTIGTAGFYIGGVCAEANSTVQTIGLTRNSSSTSTNIISLAAMERIALWSTGTTWEDGIMWSAPLGVGDVIRVQDDVGTYSAATNRNFFWIMRVL